MEGRMTDASYPLLDEAIDLYEGQLRAIGLAPDTDRSDAETNIGFTYEGETFYLELDNEDLQNVRVTLAYSLDPKVKADRAKLAGIALENTSACTAIATLIDDDGDVVFRYDAFVGPGLDVSPVLKRILDAMQAAQERFFTQVN
jgi:hypothetical protein